MGATEWLPCCCVDGWFSSASGRCEVRIRGWPTGGCSALVSREVTLWLLLGAPASGICREFRWGPPSGSHDVVWTCGSPVHLDGVR